MLNFYHKAGCPQCMVAHTKLDHKGFTYNDILVNPEDPEDIYMPYLIDLGAKGFPVLVIPSDDGNQVVVGAEVSKWVNAHSAEDYR